MLPDFMDGELPGQALDEALGHIATCDSCRMVVSDLEGVGRLYREHGRLVLPDEARRRILEVLSGSD
jgi:hypothetical protein